MRRFDTATDKVTNRYSESLVSQSPLKSPALCDQITTKCAKQVFRLQTTPAPIDILDASKELQSMRSFKYSGQKSQTHIIDGALQDCLRQLALSAY